MFQNSKKLLGRAVGCPISAAGELYQGQTQNKYTMIKAGLGPGNIEFQAQGPSHSTRESERLLYRHQEFQFPLLGTQRIVGQKVST